MNLSQAKELASRGVKMKHEYFTDMEYMTVSKNYVIFEDGSSMNFDEWIKNKDYLLEGWNEYEKTQDNYFTRK